MSARSRPPCRSRSWQSLPTLALDTLMASPMGRTIVAKGVWCLDSGHHSPLAVDRSGFHVPETLHSHKPLTGIRSSLRELDLVRQQCL